MAKLVSRDNDGNGRDGRLLVARCPTVFAGYDFPRSGL